ncbi:SDR family NAD(P)-dependent oxidoreductase [Qipengyuania vesicularis]|uniref:SDR family NAD(P)-dependent oxidoreductase n=1 Tax=Qipengyuania vesicularis TaxID=2867232 RepID=UPI001C8679B6|nr:SDR family NAD(P)-dependent oxidoreductase [Qipengyuania vesicularis]MBX7528426.1 SDR family NAD(P)-dependent oxidoreductase [Qipengyuania vesicularis]
MSNHVLIVGASRGIGLGLAKEFKERGWEVTGTERSKSDELHALEGVSVQTLDVTDPSTFDVEGEFDAVIVNAGITGAKHQSSEQATAEEVAEVMMTNAFGPVHLGKKLLPQIKDGGSLSFMSSLMGSIEDSSGGYELYRTSKTAQNMLAKGIAEQDAAGRDLAVLSLHPGWVQTDMGGPNAHITVAESARGLADVVEKAQPGYAYVDYTGKALPF